MIKHTHEFLLETAKKFADEVSEATGRQHVVRRWFMGQHGYFIVDMTNPEYSKSLVVEVTDP